MREYNYSVIVPYRDKYDLFITAIMSIPDREDIQIIIVDNSPHNLHQELIPVRKQAIITYTCSSPIKGAGCARNVGLTKVEGKYILFLDADDYFTPNAFKSFDKYLYKDYDVVFFKADSINLTNGQQSGRHIVINQLVSTYIKEGNEDVLRYQFVNPIAKMFRSDFVIQGGFQFEEIKVSNDVWFSVMTGHAAKCITADNTKVYMITAGDNGSSLTRNMTKENWFTRYQVMVRVNQFLKSVGKYKYRICLLGALRITYKEFGLKACWDFYRFARQNRIGVF